LLRKSKKLGLHTCLDTSGYSSEKKVKEILNFTDIILYDVKTLDNNKHKKLTGVSNSIILKNLELCLKSNVELIVRIPLILGYNFENLENELFDYIFQLKNLGCKKFEINPYHSFGEKKYTMLGKEYNLEVKKIQNHKLEELVENLRQKYNIFIKINTPILT
jgi:pyruvate formate lyase activating enzyme